MLRDLDVSGVVVEVECILELEQQVEWVDDFSSDRWVGQVIVQTKNIIFCVFLRLGLGFIVLFNQFWDERVVDAEAIEMLGFQVLARVDHKW